MDKAELLDVAKRMEETLQVDKDLADRVRAAVTSLVRDKPDLVPASPDFYDDTHAVLVLITHVLPGWSMSLEGRATRGNGHWTCTLRRSDWRDDDPFIGIGKGPTMPHALLAALLKCGAHK